MQIELIWQNGKSGTTTLDIEAGQSISIGRGADTDLRLTDSRLSRRHCLISLSEGAFSIEDLDSQNGTFVNARRITKSVLNDDDIVAIGGYSFAFSSTAERETTSIARSAVTTEIKTRYKPTEQGFLATEADLAGLRDVDRIRRDLVTIYRISNLISAEKNPNRLFQELLATIMDSIPADRGFLLLNSEEGSPLQIAARAGGDDSTSYSETAVNETVRTGVSILTTDAMSDERFNASRSIAEQNLRSIMCVPLEDEDRIIGAIYLDTCSQARPFTEQDLHLLAAIGLQAGMAIQSSKLVNRLQVLFFDTVRALIATIETKDPYTKGHSERVSTYAVQIARDMNIQHSGLRTIQLAGLMHDIGKIGVPEQILNKPTSLSSSEYQLIQRHPVEGVRIIKNIRYVENLIPPVLHHHERWDGRGYPEGRAGEDIPIGARIIAVADAFDAMTSARPYRSSLPAERAVAELKKKAGQQFDPRIVEVFVKRLDKGRLETPEKSFSETIAEGIILDEEG